MITPSYAYVQQRCAAPDADEAILPRHVHEGHAGDVEAGERRGYSFSEAWISGLFVDVKLTRWPPTLTEQELMLIASSVRTQDTPPKLCHTESCGGGHAGCC
jgi:hypothetical protein